MILSDDCWLLMKGLSAIDTMRKRQISTGLHAFAHQLTQPQEQANAAGTRPIICYSGGKQGQTSNQCNEPK